MVERSASARSWAVVVCIAGTPRDDRIVAFAFDEASLRGATLRAVHIWPGATAGITGAPVGFADARDDADRGINDVVTPWSEKYPVAVVHRVVRHGLDVPISLTAASKSAQLIVVGSSRRGGAHNPRPWVAETLIHRASCSVAVVPVE